MPMTPVTEEQKQEPQRQITGSYGAWDPGEKGTFELLYILDPANQESVKNRRKKPYTVSSVQNIIEEEKQRRTDLAQKAGFLSETASFLTRSADQFLSRRESTGGKNHSCGFSFF